MTDAISSAELTLARADENFPIRRCRSCNHEFTWHTPWGCGASDCDCRLSGRRIPLQRLKETA